MASVTREALLSAKPKLEAVPVPELDAEATICIRTLTGWERSEIEKMYAGKQPADDPGGFRGAVLVRCLADDAGVRLFQDTDVQTLMSLPAGLLEKLFEASCKINGFTKADVEDLEKN